MQHETGHHSIQRDTTASLLIAISDEKLRLSEKASFRNYINKESEALNTIVPEDVI